MLVKQGFGAFLVTFSLYNNYASIDPKQFQNDSFGPILVKNDFLVCPTFDPQEQIALSMIFVGVDIANCSPTREDKRRAGQDPVTKPATEHRGAANQCVQGWSARPEDKRRTRGAQDLATEPGHRAREPQQ